MESSPQKSDEQVTLMASVFGQFFEKMNERFKKMDERFDRLAEEMKRDRIWAEMKFSKIEEQSSKNVAHEEIAEEVYTKAFQENFQENLRTPILRSNLAPERSDLAQEKGDLADKDQVSSPMPNSANDVKDNLDLENIGDSVKMFLTKVVDSRLVNLVSPSQVKDVASNIDSTTDKHGKIINLIDMIICHHDDESEYRNDYVDVVEKLNTNIVSQYFTNAFLLLVYDPGIDPVISSVLLCAQFYNLHTFSINYPILIYKPGILFV
jgi:E3 ubiquitin-protein ligase DOA10